MKFHTLGTTRLKTYSFRYNAVREAETILNMLESIDDNDDDGIDIFTQMR